MLSLCSSLIQDMVQFPGSRPLSAVLCVFLLTILPADLFLAWGSFQEPWANCQSPVLASLLVGVERPTDRGQAPQSFLAWLPELWGSGRVPQVLCDLGAFSVRW